MLLANILVNIGYLLLRLIFVENFFKIGFMWNVCTFTIEKIWKMIFIQNWSGLVFIQKINSEKLLQKNHFNFYPHKISQRKTFILLRIFKMFTSKHFFLSHTWRGLKSTANFHKKENHERFSLNISSKLASKVNNLDRKKALAFTWNLLNFHKQIFETPLVLAQHTTICAKSLVMKLCQD
jgi:hypothetical protein